MVAAEDIDDGETVTHVELLEASEAGTMPVDAWSVELIRRKKGGKEYYAAPPTAEGGMGAVVNSAGSGESYNCRFGVVDTARMRMPIIAAGKVQAGTVLRVSCKYFVGGSQAAAPKKERTRKSMRQLGAFAQKRSKTTGRFSASPDSFGKFVNKPKGKSKDGTLDEATLKALQKMCQQYLKLNAAHILRGDSISTDSSQFSARCHLLAGREGTPDNIVNTALSAAKRSLDSVTIEGYHHDEVIGGSPWILRKRGPSVLHRDYGTQGLHDISNASNALSLFVCISEDKVSNKVQTLFMLYDHQGTPRTIPVTPGTFIMFPSLQRHKVVASPHVERTVLNIMFEYK